MLGSTKRRASSGVWVAALAAASIAVAGCSGGSSAGESSTFLTSTSSSSSQPSTSRTTTSSTTSAPQSSNATYAGAPGVPEAAKHKTDAGAIAFAKYYLETVNKVGQAPKVGVLEPLALPSCKTCGNHQSTVESLVDENEKFSGPQAVVGEGMVLPIKDAMMVRVGLKPLATNIVDKEGNLVEKLPTDTTSAVVLGLKWQSGWRVSEMKAEV